MWSYIYNARSIIGFCKHFMSESLGLKIWISKRGGEAAFPVLAWLSRQAYQGLNQSTRPCRSHRRQAWPRSCCRCLKHRLTLLNWVEADPAQVKMVSVIAKNIRSRREHKSKIFFTRFSLFWVWAEKENGDAIEWGLIQWDLEIRERKREGAPAPVPTPVYHTGAPHECTMDKKFSEMRTANTLRFHGTGDEAFPDFLPL